MTGIDLGEWGTVDEPPPESQDDTEADVVAVSVPVPDGRVEADEPPRLYYGSVDEFVREVIVPVFRRNVGGGRGGLQWSAEWWRSAEAIMRLEALWRSWERLRLDPATGTSVWLRDRPTTISPLSSTRRAPSQNPRTRPPQTSPSRTRRRPRGCSPTCAKLSILARPVPHHPDMSAVVQFKKADTTLDPPPDQNA